MQREDGGRALAGGVDLAEWLLCDTGGGELLLAMLAALQPAPASRGSRRQRAGPANSSSSAPPARAAAPNTITPLPLTVAQEPPASSTSSSHHNTEDQIAGQEPLPQPSASPSGLVLPPRLVARSCVMPRVPIYVGHRGDLVAVLANGAFRRPRVISELLVPLGGLELLLAQTHLDEDSPLAREWALWGVRNMCEGNEEVRGRERD